MADRRSWLTRWLFVLSLVTMVRAPVTAQNLIAEPTFGSEEGDIAPDFSIIDASGNSFRLRDYRGKQAVYLVFWNTWCGHCIRKVPSLIQRQQAFHQQLKILAINTGWDDSIALMRQFQVQHGLNYALAFDQDAAVTQQYGVWGTPTEFIIDINGVIRHRDGVPQQLAPHLAAWNQTNSEATGTAQLAGQCEGETAC